MSSNNPLGLKPGYLNWWQSLMLALACTLAGVIAAVSAMSGSMSGEADIGSWGSDLLRLTPHALMLFGILADAITYDGVYWTATIVGLSASPLHGFLEQIMGVLGKIGERISDGLNSKTPAAAAPPAGVTVSVSRGGAMSGGGQYNGCTFTGVAPDSSHKTAETLVATAAVVSYLFFDLWLNRGMINALGILVLGMLLLVGQGLAIKECFTANKTSITAGVLYGLLFGTIIGGSYYAFFQAYYPVYLPSTVIPLENTITGITDSGFVYVPGAGWQPTNSPTAAAAIANGTASQTGPTTGTPGQNVTGAASTCS